MTLKLPLLNQNVQIVDSGGKPTGAFIQWWQQVVLQVEDSINGINAALEAAGIAQAAAAAAQTAADNANAAAEAAQNQTDANARESALQSSYITPDSVLTATPTTISIAAHVRHYGDGTTANINAGTVAATASGDVDYVSYSDPSRAGGTVTFIASTTAPVQTGNTHVVGAVTIPATGSAGGGKGPMRPGFVEP